MLLQGGTMNTPRLSRYLASASFIFAVGSAATATAQDFNVPGGDLKSALDAYATQSGTQLMYGDRLVEGVYVGGEDEAIGQLIDAFERVVATQPIHDRLKDQGVRAWKYGLDKGLLTPDETAALAAADLAVSKVIAVDDFAPEELAGPSAEPPPAASSKRQRTAVIAEPTIGRAPA